MSDDTTGNLLRKLPRCYGIADSRVVDAFASNYQLHAPIVLAERDDGRENRICPLRHVLRRMVRFPGLALLARFSMTNGVTKKENHARYY